MKVNCHLIFFTLHCYELFHHFSFMNYFLPSKLVYSDYGFWLRYWTLLKVGEKLLKNVCLYVNMKK